jgi:hypothetical protein
VNSNEDAEEESARQSQLQRQDCHRPSAIIPEDYSFVAQEYLKVEDLGTALFLQAEREKIREHMAQTGGRYSQHEHGGNCHVCGSVNAIYTLLFYHAKTNSYVRMGTECADKVYEGADFGTSRFRRSVEDCRENMRGKMKAKALLGDAGLSAAYDIYAADYESLPRDPKTVRAARTDKDWEGNEEVIPAYAGDLYYEERTIRDIVSKFVKYGSVNEAQMGLLRKLVERIPDRDQRNAEWEAKKAADKAAAKPAPTGRVKIEGTVLKVEDRETQFGMVTKMTVKTDEGWIAWGSVPSNAVVEKDCRIVFVATVTPSDNDAKFAWFKRPILYMTKEEKAALKEVQKEIAI